MKAILIWTIATVAAARDPTGETRENFDACYTEGSVDKLASPAGCQRACTFKAACNTWGYNQWRADKRCHLCSSLEPRKAVTCDDDESPCSIWGFREENVTATSILNDAIELAQGVCTGELQGSAALEVSGDLNGIVRAHNIDNSFESDTAFNDNLSSAMDVTAAILNGETDVCYETYTSSDNACKYGSAVFHQLRALLVYYDGNGNRAWPMRRDKIRKVLFRKYKIFMGDNGWFDKNSLKKIKSFFSSLDSHLKTEGIHYDAMFALQTVKDAWKCGDDLPDLKISNRGFNTFQIQVGARTEQGFPGDTPFRPPSADLQLVVSRHEVGHQFDRIMKNRNSSGDPRLYEMFQLLITESEGSDMNWLRSTVGDAYFQGANQEIIASQIGNEYLFSSAAQMRLAAHRLNRVWTSFEYPTVVDGEATLTRDNFSCSNDINLGEITTPELCVAAALSEGSGCNGYEIMFPSQVASWGCRCCKAYDEMDCPVEDVIFTAHNLWDVYQYKNPLNPPTCSGPTGVAMGWFLFNVDLMTPPESNVVKFYDHEWNGNTRTFDVTLTRDVDNRIVALEVPYCGEISVSYGPNGIVDSVSANAETCVIPCENDADWRFKNKRGKLKTCEWVGSKPSKRCKKKDTNKVSANVACPEACDMCPL